QCESAGQDYMHAHAANDQAVLYLNSLLDENYPASVFPLDPLDRFGIDLFDVVIEAAWKKMQTLPDSFHSKELIQALCNHDAAEKALKTFNPIPLVSFETFKWINE